jgi:hypothetical protein
MHSEYFLLNMKASRIKHDCAAGTVLVEYGQNPVSQYERRDENVRKWKALSSFFCPQGAEFDNMASIYRKRCEELHI